MALREDKIGQTTLVPNNVLDVIPEDHPCFLVCKIVDRIDFDDIRDRFAETAGMPAYSRKALLRATVQAYIDGIPSGRALERRIKTDNVYRYLLGGETPNFRTINLFYKNYTDLIAKTELEVKKFAEEINLVKMNAIAMDGTKIKANASSYNVADKKQLKAIKKVIQEIIRKNEEEDELLGDKSGNIVPEKYLSEEKFNEIFKKIEIKEDVKIKSPSKNQLKNAIKNPQKTLKKLVKAEEELKKSRQNTVNLTDPECRWRPNKKGLNEMGYNLQNLVDCDSHIILETYVTNTASDHNELIPHIENYQEKYGQIPPYTAILADNGYYTQNNLEYIDENSLNFYIPNRRQSTLFKKVPEDFDKFYKYNFTLTDDFEAYICPNGKKLKRQKTIKTPNGTKTFYYCNSYKTCYNCPDRKECCKNSTHKVITEYGGDLAKQMYMKMASQEGEKIYAKRMKSVESPFADIKRNFKINEFNRRGIKAANAEAKYIEVAHNIKIINNYINKTAKQNT